MFDLEALLRKGMSYSSHHVAPHPLRPAQTFISAKHCVVYVVPQLQLYQQEIQAKVSNLGVTWIEFSYAFCWGLARALSRYHAINAYAVAEAKMPDQRLVDSIQGLIEEVIQDHRFAMTIFDATKTLDIEAGLALHGVRLTLHITTFPKEMPFPWLSSPNF